MIKSKQFQKICIFILLSCVLIISFACSGGSSVAHTTIQGTGTGTGATTVSGEISSFGSVYVGGIKFNTDNVSNTTIEGESGDISSLSPGMFVTVVGTIENDYQNGVAQEITFSSHLAGPISNVDSTAQTFTLNGIKITASSNTHYESNLSFSSLSNGKDITVSGSYTSSTDLTATYISNNSKGLKHSRSHDDLRPSIKTDEFHSVSGRVDEIFTGSIRVRGLAVNIVNDTNFEGNRKDLRRGDHVHILGIGVNSNTITAQRVRVEARDIDFTTVNGSIEAIDLNARTITVASNTYNTTHFTQFKNGGTISVTDMRFGLDQLAIGDNVSLHIETDLNNKEVIRMLIKN